MEHYGAAYVFINFEQAMALGHIGWGFKVEPGRYFFGSTDHLWNREYPMWHPGELIRYMDVPAGANNDYWSAFGTEEEMLTVMRSGPHVRYHSYKRVPVAVPNPAAAIAFAEALKHNGWNVARNNCVHQSHAVLTQYSGPILPNPHTTLDRIPRRWFAAIQAEEMVLHDRVRNIFPILMRAQSRRKIS
ncbi:MAG: hypothetical protein JST44_11280 [Cyanobacteria bacterium SZAS LIN-5]|nr:hypothetical protein [Cyanobacteria bacterium SZAS LIN-5]